MTSQRRCLFLLRSLGLAVVGLLSLAGCASVDEHQPTVAALLALPTSVPATPIPAQTPVPANQCAPTAAPASRLTVVPPPTSLPPPKHPASYRPNHPLSFPWLLAYESDVEGNDEIYLLPADGAPPVNVTHHPAEDRRPSWSPDGDRIAFQSNRDGNWEVYSLDVREGTVTRLTHHLAYDGAPSWSPDGNWIAFESYRDTAPCQSGTPTPNPTSCPDLEIYRIGVEGGTPQRLTDSLGGDHQPVVSPDGTWIAFTSWRTGDKEIFVLPAVGGQARNVSASAGDDWSPAWSPDGRALVFLSERDGVAEVYRQPLDDGTPVRLTTNDVPEERPNWWPDGTLLFSRYDPGPAFEAHNPYGPGAYRLYRLTPDLGLPQPLKQTAKARHPAAAPLADLAAAAPAIFRGRARAQVIPAGSLPQLGLRRLDDIQAPDPRLVAGVDQAFRAWRATVHARSGHDLLGRVSDIFRPAAYYSHRLGYLSWHKAGRAVDLLFDWRGTNGEKALYIVREDLAGEVYWRLYLKCAVQDGSLGEPLTQAPWHFWWHPGPQKGAETSTDGGRRSPIPPGYFVDVTALADRYGWSRIASYHLDDFHWKRDSTATEYWHYQHTDGLTWYQAMAQIYPQELLEQLFSRPMATFRGQTEDVMDGKGLPAYTLP